MQSRVGFIGPAVTILLALCGALAVWVASADARHDDAIGALQANLAKTAAVVNSQTEIIKAQGEQLIRLDITLRREAEALGRLIDTQIHGLDTRLQREFIALSNVGVGVANEMKQAHKELDARMRAIEAARPK